MAEELLSFNPSTGNDPLCNNILVFGYSGSGVSSFVNAAATALQPAKSQYVNKSLARTSYPATPSKSRVTVQLSKFNMGLVLPQLKLNLWESWGIAHDGSGSNYDTLELDLLLQGTLPDKFQMPKDTKALTQVIAQMKKPNNYNVIHAVAFVIPQSVVMELDGSDLTKIKAVLQKVQDRGREPILLISKVDQLVDSADAINGQTDIDEIPAVSDALKIASGLLGVPLQNVHAVVNYNCTKFEKTSKRLAQIDAHALQIVKLLCQSCRTFQQNDPATQVLVKGNAGGVISKAQSVHSLGVSEDISKTANLGSVKSQQPPVSEVVSQSIPPLQQEKSGLNLGDIFAQAQQESNIDIKVEKPMQSVSTPSTDKSAVGNTTGLRIKAVEKQLEQQSDDTVQSLPKEQLQEHPIQKIAAISAKTATSPSIIVELSVKKADPTPSIQTSIESQKNFEQINKSDDNKQPTSPYSVLADKKEAILPKQQPKETVQSPIATPAAQKVETQSKNQISQPSLVKVAEVAKSTLSPVVSAAAPSPQSKTVELSGNATLRLTTLENNYVQLAVESGNQKVEVDQKILQLTDKLSAAQSELQLLKEQYHSTQDKFQYLEDQSKQSSQLPKLYQSMTDLTAQFDKVTEKTRTIAAAVDEQRDSIKLVRSDVLSLINDTEKLKQSQNDQVELSDKRFKDQEKSVKQIRNEMNREIDEIRSKLESSNATAVDSDKVQSTAESKELIRGKSQQLLELVAQNTRLMSELERLRQDIADVKSTADKAQIQADQCAKDVKNAETANAAGCKCSIM